MKTLNFLKMQALGNDFIVLDAQNQDLCLTKDLIIKMSDRRMGIGCDQLIVVEKSDLADVFMRIYNSDGSEAGACGNATRCIADLVMKQACLDEVSIQTIAGILKAQRFDEKSVTVDMGPARLNWDQIPLSRECDTISLDIRAGAFANPVAVSMGNPHAVFFTTDVENQDIHSVGHSLEHHEIFPERANIEFVEVQDKSNIRMRVWERGAGVTMACGSGACAVGVAAIRRGLTDRRVNVHMDGGSLMIEWREDDGHVLMTGGYEYVFTGVFNI